MSKPGPYADREYGASQSDYQEGAVRETDRVSDEGLRRFISDYDTRYRSEGAPRLKQLADLFRELQARRSPAPPPEGVVEAVARAICADLGDLPDSPGVLIRGREGTRPNWEGYESTAEAAISAYEALQAE